MGLPSVWGENRMVIFLSERHQSGGGVSPQFQGIETGLEACGARADRVRAIGRTTDFADSTDEEGNERGLVSTAAFHG